MMLCMALAMCYRRIPTIIFCFILLTGASLQPTAAGPWDSQGAARAYEEARQKQNEIAQAQQPVFSQYLECAKTFRKVYLKDPHFRRSGDAIYQEARIYQEMGDKFAALDYYRTAVKRFDLLVTDYGGNPNCPDALLRMGDIYSKNLRDEEAARKAYQRLKTQYRYSSAAIQLAHRENAPKLAQVWQGPMPSPPVEVPGDASAAVQNVRYWSTSDYTRVMIDLDHDTKYEKGRLTNPDGFISTSRMPS